MAAGSRVPGFYRLSVAERRRELIAREALSEDDVRILDGGGLDAETADRVVENVIGIYGLAFGLGLNFRVNDRDFLVPMVVEEPSVIAAASNAARMVRTGGGFVAEADDAVMTAQIEVLDVGDHDAARARLDGGDGGAAGAGASRPSAAGRSRRRGARAGGARRCRGA